MADWIKLAVELLLTISAGYLAVSIRALKAELRLEFQRGTTESIKALSGELKDFSLALIRSNTDEINRLRDWKHEVAGKMMVWDEQNKRLAHLEGMMHRHLEKGER